MGTSIASSAATVDELKFSEPLALHLACSIVLRARWILLGMLERHPDFGVDERHIGGVLSHWVEGNFLILDVMVFS